MKLVNVISQGMKLSKIILCYFYVVIGSYSIAMNDSGKERLFVVDMPCTGGLIITEFQGEK